MFQNTTRTTLIYKTLNKLCCAYLNFQEMNKNNKLKNMGLKLKLQGIILKIKT